jgi:hypothetical protein
MIERSTSIEVVSVGVWEAAGTGGKEGGVVVEERIASCVSERVS